MKIYVLTQSMMNDVEAGCPAYFEPIKAFYREADAVAWRDGLLQSWRVSAEEYRSMLLHPLTPAHFEITAVDLDAVVP